MEYIFLFFTLIAALITYQLISLAIVYIWWHWPEKTPDEPTPMATYRDSTIDANGNFNALPENNHEHQQTS